MTSIRNFIAKHGKYFLLAAMMYMPIFGKLDALPIRIWDEARLAGSAYEMHKNGKYLIPHFNGYPEMHSTKPPLLIIWQSLMIDMLGVNELAVRLPSAISALLTCIVILLFSNHVLKTPLIGFFAVFVLITSQGYIDVHASRTGDYDALLTLFTTLSGLFFFVYINSKKTKYLYFFFMALTLAVLTKGIAGLLFLPAFFAFALFSRQIVSLLSNKHFYFGLLFFMVLSGGYYLFREAKNPGYLAAVQQNELGGRFLEVNEFHKGPFWFYFGKLINYQFKYWYYLLPIGALLGFVAKNKTLNKFTIFSTLMVVLFFLVISISKTKLEWYDVPLFPYFAFFVGTGVYYIYEAIKTVPVLMRYKVSNILAIVTVVAIGFLPYLSIFIKTYSPKEHVWDKDYYAMSYYLKDAAAGKIDLNNKKILYYDYDAHIAFYINGLKDSGINVSKKDYTNLSAGDTVITHSNIVKSYIAIAYYVEEIESLGLVSTYYIKGLKQDKTP